MFFLHWANDQCHDLPRHISMIWNPVSGWKAIQRLLKSMVLCLIFDTTLLSLWMKRFLLSHSACALKFCSPLHRLIIPTFNYFLWGFNSSQACINKIAAAEEFKESARSIYTGYSEHVTKIVSRTWVPTGGLQNHIKMCSNIGHHYMQKVEILCHSNSWSTVIC